MDSQKTRRPVPNIKFRVLIIGRANAGKTSILQRVCETTDSPEIYRINKTTRERIRLDTSSERGQHDIKDEVVFTKHKGYIFHDSRGFECGGNDELKVVQDFVRDRSRAKRLSDRLHAIWYCIPMDNQRPTLDLKYYHGICPDRNVPVIAVFTKYDQFKRNVRMGLEDKGDIDAISNAVSEAERLFQADYRSPLGESTTFVRLEEMHQVGRYCTDLIVTTADALNDEAVSLMLLTMQRENVELSIRIAVKRVDLYFGKETVETAGVVRQCFKCFPYLWFWSSDLSVEESTFWSRSDSRSDSSSRRSLSKHVDNLDMLISFVNALLNVLSVSQHTILQVMIVTILILEHATILRSHQLPVEKALKQAYSALMQSEILTQVGEWLAASSQSYTTDQLLEFILNARLG